MVEQCHPLKHNIISHIHTHSPLHLPGKECRIKVLDPELERPKGQLGQLRDACVCVYVYICVCVVYSSDVCMLVGCGV